jgi:hypothetical protein
MISNIWCYLVCCLRSAEEKTFGDLPEQERPQLTLWLELTYRCSLLLVQNVATNIRVPTLGYQH